VAGDFRHWFYQIPLEFKDNIPGFVPLHLHQNGEIVGCVYLYYDGIMVVAPHHLLWREPLLVLIRAFFGRQLAVYVHIRSVQYEEK
jgi:hypothetical protein